MKIMIIGYSGSGKSTLSEFLGKQYRVPVLYLDTLHFLQNWGERNEDEEHAMLADFLDRNDGWVIDGNYSKNNYERRLDEADLIILMLFNRFSCLWRALKRSREFRNKVRPSIAEGCTEKMDFEFAMWILRGGRTKRQRERYAGIAERYADKCVTIHNQRELDRYYAAFSNNLT